MFISETVDQLDLGEIESACRAEGKGALAYHPRRMLKLLVYAYATGTLSSRGMAQPLIESVPYRLLAAGGFPGHRTICRLRERHLSAFPGLFLQGVGIAQESGLVSMGTVAIDGTKMRANASKHKARSDERMPSEEKRLKQEIRRLTQLAEETDRDAQMIVAADVEQRASDSVCLMPMVEPCERNTEVVPGWVLADAGYRSEQGLRLLEEKGIRAYVALGREGRKPRRPDVMPATQRMQQALKQRPGRRRDKQRKHIAEPVFGGVRQALGFQQSSLRSLSKVRAEWSLVTRCLNRRRGSERLAW